MSPLALTEFLVKNIVKDPDMVSIKEYEDDEFITVEILADASIIGSIIGRQGNIANAIRTIVQAASYANGLKKIRINIDSL